MRAWGTLLVLVLSGSSLAAGGVSAPGLPSLAWPGDGRASLAIPDTLWEPVLASLPGSGTAGAPQPLGYTAEQMDNFGRDDLRLRTVETLFRDVRSLPRMSGKLAEDLVSAAGRPSEVVSRGFALTDVSAGRNLPLPDSASWGAAWLSDSVSAAAALEPVLRSLRKPPDVQSIDRSDARAGRTSREFQALTSAQRRDWTGLPAPVQRLVIRLLLGASEAAPVFDLAFENVRVGEDRSPAAIYRNAIAIWKDDRLGQLVTRNKGSIASLRGLDRNDLEFASMVFLCHLERALREYEKSNEPQTGSGGLASPLGISTPLGLLRISGAGVDTLKESAFLEIDLGGNDVYLGRHGATDPSVSPLSLCLDLGGDDVYEGGKEPATLGCGLLGLGAVFDLAGNDLYRCAEAGLGAAYYGCGILYDAAGDDAYLLDTHDGQGAACAGVGALIDRAGNDTYTCGYSAQGYGETLAAGILLDVEGDDSYLARDDGNPDPLYLGQSVSMAQGVGQGRRADLGDGHSFAGGFGVLVDGAGNDSYHASAWSQGAGYWWAVGILEDLGGNDRYRNGKYASGAAAHFALGCQVDLSGNDLYNTDNETTVNQFQGHARDGSIGISIDGDGDDRYRFKPNCGGSADLNSIGFFWDRRGNDVYEALYAAPDQPNGWSDTPPMGTATVYTPFRSFRDDLEATGVFLDTGGADRYVWVPGPAGSDAKDGSVWPTRRGRASRGLGLDGEIFPPRESR